MAHMTGIFSHPDCRKHDMGYGHPECPERLDAIHDRMLASGLSGAVEQRTAHSASIADLELAHSLRHIATIRGMADLLTENLAAGGPSRSQIDPDTSINAHTWDAALRSAGAAICAVDAVIAGELRNAFCATRPPGHHAQRGRAMGFCFFNNAAIGALHALRRHGLSRVAIIDFDVHHGNGTEDIVAGDQRILMASFYQHPFYPEDAPHSPASNLVNIPVPAYTKGDAIREIVQTQWLPRLEAFSPEMIFISAGFDAHREDDMGQMGLVESDYAWMTSKIVELADRHARGRIVSCLEGGYALSALARSVEAHVRALAGL